MAAHMTEAQLQANVEAALTRFRWSWLHDRDPRRNRAGFPDVLAARAGVVVGAELKTERGRTSPAQEQWLRDLGAHGYLWRPRHWLDGTILDILAGTS